MKDPDFLSLLVVYRAARFDGRRSFSMQHGVSKALIAAFPLTDRDIMEE
jgi:hypothetical protein